MSSAENVDELAKQAKRFMRKSQVAEAIELYTQALEIDERRLDLHDGLATAYFVAGGLEKSAEHFKRVSELDPRKGRGLINLGAVYNRMGNYNEAIKALRRGIPKEKQFSEGYFNLGFAHRGLKQWSMAVSAYREAVRIDPERPDGHVNLANVYVEMKNYQQAIVHFNQALELDPNFARAKQGLDYTKQAIEEAKNAISPFGRLVDKNKLGPKTVPKVERQLSDNERMMDRQKIHGLAFETKSLARSFLKQLSEDMEPQLTELSRAASHGTEAPTALYQALGKYQSALKQSADLRRDLKRKLLELRAHEELMNTPDT